MGAIPCSAGLSFETCHFRALAFCGRPLRATQNRRSSSVQGQPVVGQAETLTLSVVASDMGGWSGSTITTCITSR
jgi:hypothetical protein